MATSVVKLYKNDILTPGRNAMYAASETASGFSTWLSNSLQRTITDFQYVKHGLNISIKIDANQVIINKDIPDYPYNYVSITNSDDGRTFYYFIMDIEWVSQNTVRFILSIDSVATFWDDLDFNEKTTILREHKDRFYQKDTVNTNTTLVRKIDEEPEGINPIQVKQSELTITDANIDDLYWYLIYKTEQDASKLDENPVKCYLCASEDLKIDQATGDTSITLGNLNKNYTYFFLDTENNTNSGFSVTTTSTNTFTLDEVSGGSMAKVLVIRYDNTEAKWFVGSLFYDNNNVYTKNKRVLYVDSVVLTFINGLTQGYYYTVNKDITDYYEYRYLATISNRYLTGTSGDVYIKSIKTLDKTDTTIMKIINTPYCPINMTKTNNIWSFPNTWEYSREQQYLKLKDLDSEFLRSIRTLTLPNTTYKITDTTKLTGLKNNDLESKIYHSDITSLSFIYDSFLKSYRREACITNDEEPVVEIKFKQSNNIISNMLFDFTPGANQEYKQIEAFENILPCTRNNELTIYSSDYLNYMRNGYNFDKKANSLALTQNIINSAVGLVGTGISAGLQLGNITKGNLIATDKALSEQFGSDYLKTGKADDYILQTYKNAKYTSGINSIATNQMIGLGINAMQAATNTVFQALQQANSLKAKQANLAIQKASVSGSDDLNLMKYYSGNKLVMYEFGPIDVVKNNICDIFYYTGYAVNKQEIPNMFSRSNFNFIQCDPIFTTASTNKFIKPYLEDIKLRFNLGVTVYHNADDFDQVKENLEVWLRNAIRGI